MMTPLSMKPSSKRAPSCIKPLLFFICSLFIASQAYAGAWNQPRGDLYLALSEFYYTNDTYFDLDGDKQSQGRFFKSELNPYIEYGISDEWTVGANLFFHYVEQETTQTLSVGGTTVNITADEFNYGLGDSEFFARYQLYRDNDYVLSIQPLIKTPAVYAYDRLPKAANEDWDAEVSLLGGTNFRWRGYDHYIDTRIGYRKRFDPLLDDQLKLDAKVGIRLDPYWTLIPAAYATLSTDLPKQATFSQSGQNDYDLAKLETMIQYRFPDRPLSVHAGGFYHVWGRNAGSGGGLFIGGAWSM